MLVRFRSKQSADFIMFGDVAKTLITMMGHSGAIPGAMSAEEVPDALARLQHALSGEPVAAPPTAESGGDEPAGDQAVTLARRAVPLIEMLRAAAAAGGYIMWENA